MAVFLARRHPVTYILTFQRTICAYYHTTELPNEYAARGRREAALASKQAASANTLQKGKSNPNPKIATQHNRENSNIVDPSAGTPRTGKKKDQMLLSITSQEAQERLIEKVIAALAAKRNPRPQRARMSPLAHYFISKYAQMNDDITSWLIERRDTGDLCNAAIEDFIPRLKDHLLTQLRNLAYDGDEHEFSDADRTLVLFTDNKIYHHSILRVNYTTYDLQREQDTVNPRTRADIMVLSHEDEKIHPYWYARVIGICHVNVEYCQDNTQTYSCPTRMDFLFVRWFQWDGSAAGWAVKRLQRLEFFDEDSPDAYGFLDPDSVIRGVHLIPSFQHRSDPQDPESDCRFQYMNIFVDRDMFMRFRGGGIGHKATRDWDDILQHEGHGAEEEEEGDPLEEIADGVSDADAEEEQEDIEDDNGDSESDEEEGDDEDRVIADEGEELDDDVLAEEGYGALQCTTCTISYIRLLSCL
ncbi:hypothetical protein DFJ58DRAFT_840899 [Suillus subalutaceus]|uniref:uncharacterized protein n=1 Tax=Suillus subalutaceus TaxID=48586 RepID=UPI001B870149|nr:uncharacterized protein DFJ58DRAFT_840899 [Suillus subalutaceus]KAG1856388.1 hypothetical protein DFJ58DRAFT_840899 [Suillus subalutaceus]